jgi:hypothetical protein
MVSRINSISLQCLSLDLRVPLFLLMPADRGPRAVELALETNLMNRILKLGAL